MSRHPARGFALALAAALALSCGSAPEAAPVIQTVEVTRLVTVAPPPTPLPTPLPALIIEGTFDSGAGEWYTGDYDASSVTVVDGQLIIEVQAVSWVASGGHPDLDYLNAPFDLTMSITPLDESPESYAGVHFRWYDETNYAEFAVNAAGQVSFGCIVDGQWYEIIPWSRQTALTRNTNVVRLVDTGKRVIAYGNGTLLFDIPFEDLALGGVGMAAGTYGEGAYARWAFDDIIVREVGP